jgi:peptide/nickel transport system permease protein
MKFYVKKFVTLLLTVFLVSVLTFLAFNVIPGDPALLILGTSATPQSLAALHAKLGLNTPLPLRYVHWLGGLLRGDLGLSLQYSRPVSSLIAARIPVTGTLALFALVLIAVFSVPTGVLSVRLRGTAAGRVLDTATLMNLSLPGFFVGILFIWVFGLILHLFRPDGFVSWQESPAGFFGYLFFPALAVALPNIAVVAKFLRSSILAELSADYVRTARGKGLKGNAILYRHVLKNAMIPAITVFGMTVAEVFSGSILIEQVFGIPGLGRLLVSSIQQRDFPLLESLSVYLALLVVAANFAADLLMQAADPRIRVKA